MFLELILLLVSLLSISYISCNFRPRLNSLSIVSIVGFCITYFRPFVWRGDFESYASQFVSGTPMSKEPIWILIVRFGHFLGFDFLFIQSLFAAIFFGLVYIVSARVSSDSRRNEKFYSFSKPSINSLKHIVFILFSALLYLSVYYFLISSLRQTIATCLFLAFTTIPATSNRKTLLWLWSGFFISTLTHLSLSFTFVFPAFATFQFFLPTYWPSNQFFSAKKSSNTSILSDIYKGILFRLSTKLPLRSSIFTVFLFFNFAILFNYISQLLNPYIGGYLGSGFYSKLSGEQIYSGYSATVNILLAASIIFFLLCTPSSLSPFRYMSICFVALTFVVLAVGFFNPGSPFLARLMASISILVLPLLWHLFAAQQLSRTSYFYFLPLVSLLSLMLFSLSLSAKCLGGIYRFGV